MTPDEIWLRLMKVSSLYGDRMVEIAQRLCAAASVDREALHAVGMTAAQAKLVKALCAKLTESSETTMASPSESYAGNVRRIVSFTSGKAIRASVLAHSISFNENSGK